MKMGWEKFQVVSLWFEVIFLQTVYNRHGFFLHNKGCSFVTKFYLTISETKLESLGNLKRKTIRLIIDLIPDNEKALRLLDVMPVSLTDTVTLNMKTVNQSFCCSNPEQKMLQKTTLSWTKAQWEISRRHKQRQHILSHCSRPPPMQQGNGVPSFLSSQMPAGWGGWPYFLSLVLPEVYFC